MRIAMIGTGSIAQRHLATLTTLPDVEVVAHVSPASAQVEAAANRWGGRGYVSLDEMLDSETLDAVWITVPPDAHGTIEYRLLEQGIPFMVEKPLSADRQTAVDIAKAIETSDVIVGVAYNWRALDTITGVRDTLAKNPARMVVGTWHGSTPGTSWWPRQNASGGQMVEQATHLVDLARSLLGDVGVVAGLGDRHFRSAYPDADIADVSAALLKFDTAIGVFSATCLLENSSEVKLQFVCDGLTITITLAQVTYDYGHERHEHKTRANTYLVENQAFLEAVRQHDPGLLYCTYPDALITHHLCHDILEHARPT